MKDVEVEWKFPLLNAPVLKRKLNKVAKLKKSKDYMKDSYFVPPHKDFTKEDPIDKWFRVRVTKKGSNLTFKHWHNLDTKKEIYAEEYETDVADPESFEKILGKLDFKAVIIVEKLRSGWDYKGVEVSLDEVKNLGTFVELEAKGFKTVKEAEDRLGKILEELEIEVGSRDYKGYPCLMLEKAAGSS